MIAQYLSKQCRGCGQVQSLDEYYVHPGMADGHLNFCADYCKPLSVEWLCAPCHRAEHYIN